MRLLKFGIIGIVAVVAAAFIAGSPGDNGGPQQANADPEAIMGLNSTICKTLGIAFAGLESVNAIKYCDNINEQEATDEGIQSFVRCLRGQDVDQDGKVECTQPFLPDEPLYEPGVQKVLPADFAILDRDQNQVHEGQQLYVMLFVDDDAPVRFTTEYGRFLGVNDANVPGTGKEYFCETYVFTLEGDPDCDGNPATEGDGVVVAKLDLGVEPEPGTYTVTGIQEGIGFPMEFTIVGPPERIGLEPLFGKTVISTGATAPTGQLVGDENDNGIEDKFEDPLPTACNFGATADAVLGANSDAEKVIIVVKAYDGDDNEVVGALIEWDTPFVNTASDPFFDESDIAGVALSQTPTLDTGPLGIAFPQFLCGKDEPGTITLTARFGTVLDPAADTSEEAEIEITVIGPGENIALTVDPATVDCNGTNSATVTATVTTAEGENAANGTDVEWSVQALGTLSPLVSDATNGVATTVVTPLSGATSGVVVVATVNEDQASVLVNCAPGTGTIPPGGGEPGSGTGGAGGRPGTVITGPDTGSGGDIDGTGALSIWPVIALFTAAMGLAGARFAIRRA